VDAEEPLDPPLDLGRDAVLPHQHFQLGLQPAELVLGFPALGRDDGGDPEVLVGVDVAEGQVLELRLDPAHAQRLAMARRYPGLLAMCFCLSWAGT
jgi:hypothetical protein